MRSLLVWAVLLVSIGRVSADPPRREPIPMTFGQALERARTANPDVERQRLEVGAAEARTTQTRAAALPMLAGSATYLRTDVRNDPLPPPLPPNVLSAGVVASLPLVAPQRWARWAQARAHVAVTRLGVAEVQRQSARAVAGAYLTVIARRRAVEVSLSARDTASAHAHYAETRVRGGIASRLDQVRAQQEVETDEATLAVAQLELERAQESLGLLIGSDAPIDAADEPWLEVLDASAAAGDAVSRRPDLLRLDATLGLSERILRDGWTDYMPTVSATFSPQYSWPATVSTPTWSWQLQLALTVPLYDGGLSRGLARERQALAQRARVDQEAATRELYAELRVDDAAVRRADEALRRTRAAATLAREAVRIADLAYHAGATTNLELLDAERHARDAEAAVAAAEDSARQARVELAFATGGLPGLR